MKRSSALFASGLIAAVASVLLIAWKVFVALGGYAILYERFGLTGKAPGYVQGMVDVIVWGLFLPAFFFLLGDRRNRRSALLGGISSGAVLLVRIVGVVADEFGWSLGGCPPWAFSASYFLLFLCYGLAVVLLRTAVPTGLRIVTIVAVTICVVLDLGWAGASVCYAFVEPGSAGWDRLLAFYKIYGPVATWPSILCWVVMAVYYVVQAVTGKNVRQEASRASPVCGVVACKVHEAITPIRKAIVADTMELTCPKCGQKCEVSVALADGQHLFCPYCNEKFAYHRQR